MKMLDVVNGPKNVSTNGISCISHPASSCRKYLENT